MNRNFLMGMFAATVLSGCSSSSNNFNAEDIDDVTGGIQMLRLISEQRSLANGNIVTTNYQYDETGNLIGSVSGNNIFTYNIEPDGRINSISGATDGVIAQAILLHFYDPVGGLRRIDNLASLDGISFIGVSFFEFYSFENDLATTLESRRIPFEDIILNGEVDDLSGELVAITEFEYENQRLVRELIDDNGDGVIDTESNYNYNANETLSSVVSTGASANQSVFIYEQGSCNLNWGNSTHGYFCVPANSL